MGRLTAALVLLLALAAPRPVWAQASTATDEDAATRSEAEPLAPEVPAETPAFDPGVTSLPASSGAAYRLEVRAPKAVRDLLVQHLDLTRFREQPDVSPGEVGRLLAATPAQARALLETEGYFDARVEVQRIESTDGTPPLVIVDVTPGARARVGRVQLEVQGALAEGIDAGQERLKRRWQRLQDRWTLPVGAKFSQDAWNSAKADLLARLHQRDFPSASFIGTGAEVDADRGTVRLFVVVDSGPSYRIGDVRIEGLERTPREAAINVMPFAIGARFTEQMLVDFQEALQKTGLYAGVTVELELDPATAEQAVILVKLREQKLQSATPSIGYSTNTGARVGLEYTHRRLFGRDLVGSTVIKLGREERVATFDLLTYPQERNYRYVLSAQAEYLNAGGAKTQTQRVRAGRSRDTLRIDRFYYLEYNQTTLTTRDVSPATDRAVLANYEWVRQDVNNLLFPTRGLILSAQAGAGYAYDADNDSGLFTRLYLQAVWYQPLGGGWFGQLRGEAAEVFKQSSLRVPDSLLFRAGGNVSVRGYGFRTLGPVSDGSVVGGPVMATGTAEVMRRLSDSESWRDWFGAVFVDAGNAADDWGNFKAVYGYGVGVRWRSPIGPFRADIAYGQEVSSVRLHVSVGVNF